MLGFDSVWKPQWNSLSKLKALGSKPGPAQMP